jgi:hypothetical protein
MFLLIFSLMMCVDIVANSSMNSSAGLRGGVSANIAQVNEEDGDERVPSKAPAESMDVELTKRVIKTLNVYNRRGNSQFKVS